MYCAALAIAVGSTALLPNEPVRVPVAAPEEGGRLEGRVVEVDGEPLAEAFLVAVPLDRVGERLGWAGRPLAVRGEPADPPRTVTDRAGRFAFEGLADEPYRVFLLPRHPFGHPRELTREPARPGADLGEVVPEGAVLLVDVVGVNGRPYPLMLDTFPPQENEHASLAWCGALDPQGQLPPMRRRLRPARVDHGRAFFDVEPGRSYRVGAAGVVSRPVHVGGPLTRLALVSTDAVTTGELALVVRDPDGRPYDFDIQVMVLLVDDTPDSWRDGWLAARSQGLRGPRFRSALEAGRYRLTVTAHENLIGWCDAGWEPAPTPFRPGGATFEIRAGEETRLDVELSRPR